MYILDFLRKDENKVQTHNVITVEYRLLCSGEIYNGDVQASTWRIADAARSILLSPFIVLVASRPFEDFPQELALRFSVQLVTEKRDNNIRHLFPDEEVAGDIAALLTVFCRRLITTSAKTKELYPYTDAALPDWARDIAIPFLNTLKKRCWERRQPVWMEGPAGIEILDYNPKPKAISPKMLTALLLAVPELPHKESFLHSARLYAAALERIHYDVDSAYQLLVASAETIANDVLSEYKPETKELVETKRGVFTHALELGLTEEQATQLAIDASKDLSWHKRKFVKFLLEYNTADLTTEDDLFQNPDYATPKSVDLESLLGQIYSARGGAFHAGASFPATASAGTGPLVSSDLVWELMTTKKPFLPIPWFERVLNSALQGYVVRHIGGAVQS